MIWNKVNPEKSYGFRYDSTNSVILSADIKSLLKYIINIDILKNQFSIDVKVTSVRASFLRRRGKIKSTNLWAY